ncbi:MAG TPA: CRISPR-associated endonuclease Cas1 [Patescibacteria group bacterium]|nr:CRISPR-associated endonuclease Cas1 [Patescibacteria group bacterium]
MKTRTTKLFLTGYGDFLGRAEGCLTVRHRNKETEKYPLFANEVSEIQISMGNSVSSVALASCAFWNIDVAILTQRGAPVAYLKNLADDSHVKTRISQYESLKNGKGLEIAKQIVLAKIEGQNQLLRKNGLRQLDMVQLNKRIADADSRQKLITIEGHCAELYFRQIFQLMPKSMRIERRRGFKAYDIANNILNLAYEILRWKVYRAIIRAKLEPFLGFVHSEQFGKPSLVCDLMEPYRCLIDDFVIQYCKSIKKKDFISHNESYSGHKQGQRQYLKKAKAQEMTDRLNKFFESIVEIPRVRHGKRQTFETLINEEALLLAQYLRKERKDWAPRIFQIS